MAIGMSAEEFWEGDPRLAPAYRKAHERRSEIRNWEDWKLGHYMLLAHEVALEHAFVKNAQSEYPDGPIFVEKAEMERLERERERAEMERSRARLTAWAAKVNEAMAARGEKAEG